MKTDYKIRRLTKNDDGSVTAVVGIYEGDYEMTNDLDIITKLPTSAMRYVRKNLMRTTTVRSGDEAQIHRQAKAELVNDRNRQPINEQKITVADKEASNLTTP